MRTTVANPADIKPAFERLQKLAGSGVPGVAGKAQAAVNRATLLGLKAAVEEKPQ